MVATIQAYWRPKPRPRHVKKPKKVDPEEQREKWRRIKREQRAKAGPEAAREARQRDFIRACDLDLIRPHVQEEDATGCWIWLGMYKSCWEKPRPYMTVGSDGKIWVDIAAYLAAGGKKIRSGCWLSRSCGNLKCVNPAHGVIMNHVVQRAQRRLAYEQLGKEDGPRPEGPDGEGRPEGCAAARRAREASADASEQGDG